MGVQKTTAYHAWYLVTWLLRLHEFMNIELWLIEKESLDEKQLFKLDLPVLPRKGDTILVGEDMNYEITEIIFRLDEEGRFSGRITVEAESC